MIWDQKVPFWLYSYNLWTNYFLLENNYIFFYLVLKEKGCDKQFKLFHKHSIKYLTYTNLEMQLY